MLKSCKYCGHIYDSRYGCGRRPPPKKKITYKGRFHSSRKWREKREQIRQGVAILQGTSQGVGPHAGRGRPGVFLCIR